MAGIYFILAEYVVTEPEFKRMKYRFHLQSPANKMLARWDNSPHHPDHLHLGENVKANPHVELEQVLEAVLSFIK